jgi:MoaA/NifB/PqqE/SkfB family radical SAM enzyme
MSGVISLREIIWETSLSCNKNCAFCGSKDVIGGKVKGGIDSQALAVAQKISEYAPEELVLSGGEPGMLTTKTLESIFLIFSQTNTKLKVISNGFILNHKRDVLKKFHRVGLSVNTENEMREITQDKTYTEIMPLVTFVTNFGKHNIWEFWGMLNFFKIQRQCHGARNMMWQIQLTQGEEFQLPANGIDYLRQEIDKALLVVGKKDTIVMADNLRVNNTCGAGTMSCGILANGDVVPCLSYRCWSKDDLKVQGNVLKTPLKDIWETGFRDYRFGKTKCCRDCIDFGKCDKKEGTLDILLEQLGKEPEVITLPGRQTPLTPLPKYPRDGVYVYGVVTPQTILYGVTDPGGTGTPPYKQWVTTGSSTVVPVYGCAMPPDNDDMDQLLVYGLVGPDED